MTDVIEHPILFSTSMVRAILDGRKTQTRRVLRRDFSEFEEPSFAFGAFGQIADDYALYVWETEYPEEGSVKVGRCPYGKPGDRLWVRESFGWEYVGMDDRGGSRKVLYRADSVGLNRLTGKWKPSIHMPRDLSRITLDVVDIRVERLQAITERDARAEGVCGALNDGLTCGWGDLDSIPVGAGYKIANGFRLLWDSINADRGFSWKANPWVWVVEFKRSDE